MAAPKFILDLIDSLSEEDRGRAAVALGIGDPSGDDLASALEGHAKAALAEYLSQYTGRQVPRRMADLDQLRLLQLSKYANSGVLPTPDEVGRLFQKTATEAKTLLRNTATRYRHELKQAMDDAAWVAVTAQASLSDEDGVWIIEIRDEALLEHINEAIRLGPGSPRGLRSTDPKRLHVYLLDKQTATAMLGSLGRTLHDFETAIS